MAEALEPGARVSSGHAGETFDPATVQSTVDAWFDSHTQTWIEVYDRTDLSSVIYSARRDQVLAWIASLRLRTGALVLELGCGAGLMAIALTAQILSVIASDRTHSMLLLTRHEATNAGIALRIAQVDAHAPAFADEAFELVVALGVIPWLHSPRAALAESARLLRPGGYLVVSADNRARLVHWLDPRFNPLLGGLRRAVRALIGRSPEPGIRPKLHWPWEFNSLVESVGLELLATASIGFGPFTVLGVQVVGESQGLEVHRRLQRLSDQRRFGMQLLGSHYLVLARKR